MTEMDDPLVREYEDRVKAHEQALLLARLSKLLEYDDHDLESEEFKRNFKECQMLYEELQ